MEGWTAGGLRRVELDCSVKKPQRGFGVGLAALKLGVNSLSSHIALGTRQLGTGINETQAAV